MESLWIFLIFVVFLILIGILIWATSEASNSPVTVLERGKFVVFDTDVCAYLPTCFGQNPDSPYARLIFPGDLSPAGLAGAFTLLPNEVVLIRGISPPMARYFGFTLYLFNREDGEVPFASLGDSLNNLDLGFNQPFTIIVTGSPELATQFCSELRGLKSQRDKQDLKENCWVLPVPMADTVLPSDGLLVVMRTAFFSNNTAGNEYLENLPITGIKVRVNEPVGKLYPRLPLIARPITPDEKIYQAEFDTYVNSELEVIEEYGKVVQEVPFHPFLEDINYDSGYDCIDSHVNCLGDNRDTAYFLTDSIVLGPNQALFVSGVNHVNTEKATYVSQSLYDTERQFGVGSLSDNDISDNDRFYTFAFTRKTIPGLPFPQFVITDPTVHVVTLAERAYVQPGSHIGSSTDTLIAPEAFLVQLNSEE